jgi:hypothetical protein
MMHDTRSDVFSAKQESLGYMEIKLQISVLFLSNLIVNLHVKVRDYDLNCKASNLLERHN